MPEKDNRLIQYIDFLTNAQKDPHFKQLSEESKIKLSKLPRSTYYDCKKNIKLCLNSKRYLSSNVQLN